VKFLLHGNSPHVGSGYGVQLALLSERLKASGHDVAFSSTYGQQGGAGIWRGMTVYPAGFDPNGNDSLHLHAAHHFGGDELGGWIVTLLDVWALTTPMLKDCNVAAWCPVDHLPVPPDVLKFFHNTGATPLAMSRFGQRLLQDAGLDPVYIPLSVDTKTYKPTNDIRGKTAREFLDIPEDAFVVGMVAMNKGWARDRKGFNEAFRAFGRFHKNHPDAILYLHAEKFGGAEGLNLVELATHCSIPVHAIRWVDQYAYRLGCPPEMMAATYTAMDVLLAPSHGEGFCVPLLEAQACRTPVIASDFSSQPELVDAGWLVSGQLEWDPAQHASYLCPFTSDVLARLEDAHAADMEALGDAAFAFAARYDSDLIFEHHWQPFLESIEPVPVEPPNYDRSPMPDTDAIAVIVPAMRQENVKRLAASFDKANDGSARLVIIEGPDTTYAEKVNAGYAQSTEPWVLLVGDDVVFHPGWIQEARKLSADFDVIGTNDTSGPVKNPDVAAGRHADHFFVRRAYVESEGSCLEGPGVLAPEAYRHWYVDMEMIGLAKARGVFTPCLNSVVEHLHPGYDGDERARQADPVYMRAVDHADADAKTFRSRLPLIEQHRTTRAKVR
jgi:glycosyltransferase involved in cell wall biosynthesis